MNKLELLEPYRASIDAIDNKIIDLLVERTGVIREVGQLKYSKKIPAVIAERIEQVRERSAERAQGKGLDPDLVRQIYTVLIDYSCDLEDKIIERLIEEEKNCAA